MIMKHEESVTVEQANKIKKEVYALNCPNLKVNYKQTDDSTYKTITIAVKPCSLEEKVEASNILREYGKSLRQRLFNNEV